MGGFRLKFRDNKPEQGYVAPVIVNDPVSVNVDNNGRYRSRYCKRVYSNGTISVNVYSNVIDISLLSTFTLTGSCDDNMCDINAFCLQCLVLFPYVS